MQISNIFLTVLATGASLVAADDTTSGTTTSTIQLTKTKTLTSVATYRPTTHATSTYAAPTFDAPNVMVAASTTSANTSTPAATSTYFPMGNSTTGYATGTGAIRVSATGKASGLTGSSAGAGAPTEAGSSASASASSNSTSAAAPGVQAVQGGLLLCALATVAMLF